MAKLQFQQLRQTQARQRAQWQEQKAGGSGSGSVWQRVQQLVAPPLPPTQRGSAVGTVGVHSDFVLVFRVPQPQTSRGTGSSASDREQWLADVESHWLALTDALHTAGVGYEVRLGARSTATHALFFVFVLLPDALVEAEHKKQLVEDWLAGVTLDNPLDSLSTPSSLSVADRLRLQYRILTNEKADGGAALVVDPTADLGLIALFPLHDELFNAEWLKNWSSKSWISQSDLTLVRNQFGENIAFYFSFLKSYTESLTIPSCLALLSTLSNSSLLSALSVPLWSIVFVELFKRRQRDLAVCWNTFHVSRAEKKALSFRPQLVKNVDGKFVKSYPVWKRVVKQLLVVPVVTALAVVLGSAVTAVNVLEVLLVEHYHGDYKKMAVIVPSIAYSMSIGPLTKLCYKIARKLNDWENHETETKRENNLAKKLFIFNSLLSYSNVFLATFVYLPFGNLIFPNLVTLAPTHLTIPPTNRFTPTKIESMVRSQMVVKQIKSTISETIGPYISKSMVQRVSRVQRLATLSSSEIQDMIENETEDEFLERVEREFRMPEFELEKEYTEMCVQFGQVGMYSAVWKWTSVSALVNNFVELRGDAFKLVSCRRSVPVRVESLGAWLRHMRSLAYISPIIATGTYLLFTSKFESPVSRKRMGIIFATLLASESLARVVSSVVAWVSKTVPSAGDKIVKKKEEEVRRGLCGEVKQSLEKVDGGGERVGVEELVKVFGL